MIARDKTGVLFGIIAGCIVLILLLIVLVPWLRTAWCPGFSFNSCVTKSRAVNVNEAFDEELMLDEERIKVEKEVAR